MHFTQLSADPIHAYAYAYAYACSRSRSRSLPNYTLDLTTAYTALTYLPFALVLVLA